MLYGDYHIPLGKKIVFAKSFFKVLFLLPLKLMWTLKYFKLILDHFRFHLQTADAPAGSGPGVTS